MTSIRVGSNGWLGAVGLEFWSLDNAEPKEKASETKTLLAQLNVTKSINRKRYESVGLGKLKLQEMCLGFLTLRALRFDDLVKTIASC